MIPDLDIYRSANVLVKQHGQDAPIEAAMRADELLAVGDLDGVAVWKRILRAVLGPRAQGTVEFAVGGRADVLATWPELRFLAMSGSQDAFSWL